jgi:hypothetical protein
MPLLICIVADICKLGKALIKHLSMKKADFLGKNVSLRE